MARREESLRRWWLLALLLQLLALAVTPGAAELTNYLRQADKDAAYANLVQYSDGSYGSLEETCQAAGALYLLKKAPADPAAACKYASGKLAEASSTTKILLSICTIEALSCSGSIPSTVVPALTKALEDSKQLEEIFSSSAALSLLKGKGHLSTAIPSDTLEAAAATIKSLTAATSGFVKSAKGDAKGTAFNAGLAFQALTDLISLGLPASKVDFATTSAAKIFRALVKDDAGGASFPSDKGTGTIADIVATAAVIRGLVELAEATSQKLSVTGSQFKSLAIFLTENKVLTGPTAAFHLLDALHLLSNNPIAVPLAVGLDPATLDASSPGKLAVDVRTVEGGVPPGIKVVAKSFAGPGGSSLISTTALSGSPPTLDLSSVKTGFGPHKLSLEVSSGEPVYTTVGAVALPVSVLGSVTVKEVILSTSTPSKELVAGIKGDLPPDAIKVSFKETAPGMLSLDQSTTVSVAFAMTGSDATLQQVFLQLTAVGENARESVVAVAKKSKTEYTADLLLKSAVSKLKHRSGEYELALVVGDEFLTNSFRWTLASAQLALPPATSPPAKDYEIVVRNAVLPDIIHVNRKPDSRPPETVSFLFTALVVAVPWAILLAGLAAVGANLKGFPSQSAIFPILFHLGIIAIALLLTVFWLRLNLLQLLSPLLALIVYTTFVGHKALSDLASGKVKTS